MSNLIKEAKEEIVRLKHLMRKIDNYLAEAPAGCLQWQNKKGKIYYYQQPMMREEDNKEDCVNKKNHTYIKKQNLVLAENLAKKHYYIRLKSVMESNLRELQRFVNHYHPEREEEVYNTLNVERKRLVLPIEDSISARVQAWQEETYEQNTMYPETLKYETDQGEIVRSKSEVIIANILYKNLDVILYKYEKPLTLMYNGSLKTIYPDFTLINVRSGKVLYWEHAGCMDDSFYSGEFVKKMKIYVSNDLMIGRDVIWTFETQETPLDIRIVKKIVDEIIEM